MIKWMQSIFVYMFLTVFVLCLQERIQKFFKGGGVEDTGIHKIHKN